MTLDELNDEVQIAINKVALLIKEMYLIGEELTRKAEACEADRDDVMVSLMTYVAAIQKLQESTSVN